MHVSTSLKKLAVSLVSVFFLRREAGMAANPTNGTSSSSSPSLIHWVSEHRLLSVGLFWASGLAGSLAYNWTRPHMSTSVKILHARVHAQALTLAALVGASAVEYYEHHSGDKAKRYEKHF